MGRYNKSQKMLEQYKMPLLKECVVVLKDIRPLLSESEVVKKRKIPIQSVSRDNAPGISEEISCSDVWSTCSCSTCYCSACYCSSCTYSTSDEDTISVKKNSINSCTSDVSSICKERLSGKTSSSVGRSLQKNQSHKTLTPTLKQSVQPLSLAPKPLKKRDLKVSPLNFVEHTKESSSRVSQPLKVRIKTMLKLSHKECSKRYNSPYACYPIRKENRSISPFSLSKERDKETFPEDSAEKSRKKKIKKETITVIKEHFQETDPRVTPKSLRNVPDKSLLLSKCSKASSSKPFQPKRQSRATLSTTKTDNSKKLRNRVSPVKSIKRSTVSPRISLSEGVNTFKCTKCAFFNTDKASVSKHYKREHNNDVKWKCIECNFETGYYGIYLNHSRQHFEGPPFGCTECYYESNTFQSLLKHTQVHVKNFKCNLCEFACKTSITLNKHKIKIHNEENEFKCVSCDKGYKLAKNLKRHKSEAHGKESGQQQSLGQQQMKNRG